MFSNFPDMYFISLFNLYLFRQIEEKNVFFNCGQAKGKTFWERELKELQETHRKNWNREITAIT